MYFGPQKLFTSEDFTIASFTNAVAAADVHPAGDMPPGSHADETDAVQSLESGECHCVTSLTFVAAAF